MESSMFVILTVLNILSMFIFFVVNRETRRITESHIELIRKVNAALVETRILKIARVAYFILLVLLIGFSYLVYFYWVS